MSFLHQLDIWAYQLVVGVWQGYWPSFLVILALAGLERLFPIEAKQPFRPWLFNVAWHAVFLAFAVLFTWGAWGGFVAWLTSLTGRPLLRFGPADGLLEEGARILLAMLVYDFIGYWWHRLQHSNRVLWVMHQFHHDERHMNASTSFRTQWVNLPFNQLVVQVPLTWMLGYEASSPTVTLVLTVMIAFSHSNIRVNLGPFTRVFVGPALHRVHHDRERRLSDSNYASLFPLWDLAFGTYRAPPAGPVRPLGLSEVGTTDSYLRAFLQPLADWTKILRGGQPAGGRMQ